MKIYDTLPYISQKEDKVHVFIELPGFEKSDVNLSTHNQILKIKAKRKLFEEEQSYSESIKIIDDYDVNKISAEMKNGLLDIAIPLKNETKEISIF